VADVYTHGHQDAVLRSHRWRTVANSAAYLAPHLEPGKRVLDIGCGPGTLTADIARHVDPGLVTGIDRSAVVIAEARGLGDAIGNVSFEVGDLYAWPRGTAYDIVHAHQVLQHLSDPVDALRHMRALAEPAGIVAARDGDYSSMAWAPADARLDRWLAIYLEVTRRNRADADAGRHLPAWFRTAGFSNITFTTSTWTFWTAADREWWGALWAERCESSDLAGQAVDYGIATAAELAELAAGWREWSATDDGVFVVMHGEVIARV
jgi:SAM-dependent methyltransferase